MDRGGTGAGPTGNGIGWTPRRVGSPIAACRSRSPIRRACGSRTRSVSPQRGEGPESAGEYRLPVRSIRPDDLEELDQQRVRTGDHHLEYAVPFPDQAGGLAALVCGPANYFKDNAHPLTAIIESDWITMSFTMNWKIMRPDEPVRFEVGEPLFQAIPLSDNACADLEGASVTYKKLDDDPEVARAYREWDQSRIRFMERSKAGGAQARRVAAGLFPRSRRFGTAGRPRSHDEGETAEGPLRRNGGSAEPGNRACPRAGQLRNGATSHAEPRSAPAQARRPVARGRTSSRTAAPRSSRARPGLPAGRPTNGAAGSRRT